MPSKYDEYPSLYLYDKLNVPYVLFSQHWDGPIWTGHCMMLSTADSYGDPGFWHELAHYMVSGPTQRTLPDMALGQNVNAHMDIFTSSSTPYLHYNYVEKMPKKSNLDGIHKYFHGPGLRGYNRGWGELPVPRLLAAEQESWACHALQYYEPLCGITAWDRPYPANHAIYDFAGDSMPEFSERVAIGCYKRFVEPLGLGSLEDVLLYTKLCANLSDEELDEICLT